ncbi:MAG: apolipoprotein N-acyltransferase [Rickettsiales bacterium]
MRLSFYFRYLDFLTRTSGFTRNMQAVLLGVLATLALPPVHFFPTVFIAFPGLFVLLQSAPTKKRASLDGFYFGLGHFISGFYWIAYSLMVDPERYAWLIPFTVIGLNGLIALFPTLFAFVFKFISEKLHLADPSRLLAAIGIFSLLWLGDEYLRGHIFTGFPWNLIGYVWTASDISMQIFWWLGAYLTSFLTVLISLAPLLLNRAAHERLVGYGLLACIVLICLAGAGRLSNAANEMIAGITLRIVQADIPQTDKWDPKKRWAAYRQHLALSRSKGYENITHIIWPETAMTYMFTSGDRWARELAEVAPEHGALLTGVVRMEGSFQDGTVKLFNSLQSVNRQAQVQLVYDKIKLVPFGEFIPLRDWIPIPKITVGTIDFSRGTNHQALTLPGLPPIKPLICYEAIFPEMSSGAYPAWLLNITNDAWFGDSPGPYQHLMMSRVRAVEQGVPLIRAANTGISAVIDPYGRILQQLPLNTPGIIDTPLPKPIPR